MTGRVEGAFIKIGSPAYMTDADLPPVLADAVAALESEGKTVILAQSEDRWLGALAVADTVRPESARVVARLKARGIEVAMLTGDNERVARSIARSVGIERVYDRAAPRRQGDGDQAVRDRSRPGSDDRRWRQRRARAGNRVGRCGRWGRRGRMSRSKPLTWC
ncbi:MAG: HAD family hydrolase [Blastochloris sp.]|nr:HAD family hydrolase [Blastochloris sp.]